MGKSFEAADVARLYREAREVTGASQEEVAECATAYLLAAARGKVAWAAGGSEVEVERHFVARVETVGSVGWSRPATRIRARALAESLGVEWADVLVAAGMLVPEDLGGPG
jgi:hypothetical protein